MTAPGAEGRAPELDSAPEGAAPEDRPPDVTVVIPTRDRSAMLNGALRSALGQEGIRVEVLAVDDGSRDSTPDLLAGIGDPRLSVIRHDSARGVAHARNRALERARGEWIAFLDDDDLWSPRFLRTVVGAARPLGAVLAYARTIMLDGRREPVQIIPNAEPPDLLRELLRRNAIGAPCGVVLRTDVVRRVGGFDERLSLRADWDLWIRVAQEGPGVLCSEVLVGYTRHASSMSLMHLEDAGPELQYMRRKHASLARRHGVRFGVRPLLTWRAETNRRAGRRVPAAFGYMRLGLHRRRFADVLRGLGLLLGERAMRVGQRPAKPVPPPDWLHLYWTP
jgi:glycosyltransferase involved in cell wall biosynthesis